MAPSQDSDSEPLSGNSLPPVRFDFNDEEPYQHLLSNLVVDAITRGEVNEDTKLAALYTLNDASVDNQLLLNLTTATSPAVLCQIVGDDGTLYPPRLNSSYRLWLTYNTLLLAPRVRLECEFVQDLGQKSEPYLTLVVEFHFSDFNGLDSGIQSYRHLEDGTLTFKAKGATTSGFNWIPHFDSLRVGEARELIELLHSLLKPQESKSLQFKLHDELLTAGTKAELAKVRDRLPGGVVPLLPSIGMTEYKTFGDYEDRVHYEHRGMLKPGNLISGPVPFPMVQLDCSDTFSTIKEAGVQLGYAAFAAAAESSEALRLWAAPVDKGKLYQHGSLAVVGADFNPFKRLGSASEELHFTLPSELYTRMSFQPPGWSRNILVDGYLASNIHGLPKHDAHFLITSKTMKYFTDNVESPRMGVSPEFDVKFRPHENSFMITSQLETINQLQMEKNQRHHRILLNQVHDTIEDSDLTEGADSEVLAEADRWLLGWMDWNAEQLQVIKGIKKAKGGFPIVMGPAGTGKTLLQLAISIYFYKLGSHALVLAPTNSNADLLANVLLEIGGIPFCRLYTASKDLQLDKMNERQAAERRMGPYSGRDLSLSELLIALEELIQRGSFTRKFGVVERVIDSAMNHEHELHRRLRDDAGNAHGEVVDVWEVLRELIAAYKNRTFEARDEKDKTRFKMAYIACKGHIISLCRFMITTTGNVRAAELRENWYKEDFGVSRKGVIVFIDEAAKDVEANLWAGIVCEAWSADVKGVFMFGDDKQLSPVNTCSKDKLVFNPFLDRLNIALPRRLIREGFPYFVLREQRRMNECIAAFPNQEIYHGELRNGPEAKSRLNDRKPGLARVLTDIISDHGTFATERERQDYREEVHDHKARLHYIEVQGNRIAKTGSRSMIVEKHLDTFFDVILPPLRAYFKRRGESVEDNLMVICAYGAALREYQDGIKNILKHNSRLTAADMPRVLTVDSSQGQESFMVIFDGSFQHGDVIGFMTDPGRTNVAITRAKEVFWMIGGSMEYKFRRSYEDPNCPNLITKYKRLLDNSGMSHKFAERK